jgi:hypothetical protein
LYQDALQPAAKELSRELVTIVQAVHVVLAPLRGLIYGYEQIREFVAPRIAEKLRNTPPERIAQPNLNIVGPAFDALRFAGHKESLREMYAQLLATSLDSQTAEYAHPAFVDMIKNMSPDEAKIMAYFAVKRQLPVIRVQAVSVDGRNYDVVERNYSLIGQELGCEHPSLAPSYLSNLERLGLILLPDQSEIGLPRLVDAELYEPLESAWSQAKAKLEIKNTHTLEFIRGFAEITALGNQFCRACISDVHA